jgi:tripartite-type tricarboxylate transporter receptor subunit TctC
VVGGTAGMNSNNQVSWQKDLVPVSFGGMVPANVIAVGSVTGIKNFGEFQQRITSRSVNFGTPGVGTPGHMYSEIIKRKFQANMIHVPYKGASPAMVDLINGNIDMYIGGYVVFNEMVKAGRVVPLAVIGNRPLQEAPTVPTTSSLGMPEFEPLSQIVNVFWVSSKTPPDIIRQLQINLSKAYNNEKSSLQEKMLIDASYPVPLNFVEYVTKNTQLWEDFSRSLNLNR